MTIEKDTEMLLFRFKDYKGYLFIKEHCSVLDKKGYVWMLKLGKRTSIDKLKSIRRNGGWLILRSPKSDGGKSYLAKFTQVSEDIPQNAVFPAYYKEILDSVDTDELYDMNKPSFQWFRLEYMAPISDNVASSLVVVKTGKKVDDVISTTRTAVMFVKNDAVIEVPGVI